MRRNAIAKWTGALALSLITLTAAAIPAAASVDAIDATDRVEVTDPQFAESSGDGTAVLHVTGGANPSTFASGEVRCSVKANAPHKSIGAGGVIYKSTVVCNGYGTYPKSVTVRVNGGLFYDSAPYAGEDSNVSFVQVRSSSESRVLLVNGTTSKPFYTPPEGVSGHRGMGHYRGTSTIVITNPTGYKSGTHTSGTYFLNALY